jgi:tetratricopeptide (TPR) repeat protein
MSPATLGVALILSAFLTCIEAPHLEAQAPENDAAEQSSKWSATLANSATGLVMRSSQTRSGNGVISIDELQRRKTIPDAVWKQYRRALTEDDRGHHSESFRLAMSAAALWPAFPQAHDALAVSYLRTLDLPNAEREIRTASALDPYYLSAQELQGIVYLVRGDLSEARKTLAAVLVIDSTRGVAQYFLARTLADLGEFSSANEHLEMSTGLHRHPAKALVAGFDPVEEP